MSGTLFVISAPSGAGKTSLVAQCLDDLKHICVSVSHTTRAPRPGETNGVNYHFISTSTFQNMLEKGDFLESAQVFDNDYGTSQQSVEQNLKAGIDVILEIDWQGAQQVRKQFPNLISIFILPPSLEILAQRLRGRGQDEDGIIQKRLAKASAEMTHFIEYDYLVINDDFDQATQDLKSIILSTRLKQSLQADKNQNLLKNLLSS